MTERAKTWAILFLITIIAVLALPQALKGLLPNVIGSADVPEEGRSADVDFPVVLRVKGGLLEVASVTGTRHFPKSSDPEILGKSIPYCREKASWSAPYKITYRVRLGSNWTVRYHDGRLIAQVPDLEPALPVAFDSSRLTKGAKESCWFFPDQGTRDRALKSISPQLSRLARNPRTRSFAREAARNTVKEFLRTWALKQQSYTDLPPDPRITVYFPGE